MIKRGWGPTSRRVTLLTKSGEPCRNMIRVGHTEIVRMMAGVARRWSPGVTRRVAAVACDGCVRSRQWESAEVMIERRRRPGSRRMALLAQSRETACHVIRIGHASVIAGVTCITRCCCARKSGGMATIACHALMCTGQGESSLSMSPG